MSTLTEQSLFAVLYAIGASREDPGGELHPRLMLDFAFGDNLELLIQGTMRAWRQMNPGVNIRAIAYRECDGKKPLRTYFEEIEQTYGGTCGRITRNRSGVERGQIDFLNTKFDEAKAYQRDNEFVRINLEN